jgi:DNA-3-methyladenine glycosylase II
MTSFTLVPDGRFSLAAAASFGFGPNMGRPVFGDSHMTLAFATDDFENHAAVRLSQGLNGEVVGDVISDADPAAVETQVRRILSLDHSGEAWEQVGKSDTVVGMLQDAHPGLRPVLFHSPYEAAAWSIISARRHRAQGTVIRNRLAVQFGRVFDLATETATAFPTPHRLLEVDALQGLDEVRIRRLHAVARAALDGQLEAGLLLSMSTEDALEHLQRLPGIGPTYSTLILLRSTGATDTMTGLEPRLASYLAQFYELGSAEATDEEVERISNRWRPFRTWAAVLCRVAGDARGIPFPSGSTAGARTIGSSNSRKG